MIQTVAGSTGGKSFIKIWSGREAGRRIYCDNCSTADWAPTAHPQNARDAIFDFGDILAGEDSVEVMFYARFQNTGQCTWKDPDHGIVFYRNGVALNSKQLTGITEASAELGAPGARHTGAIGLTLTRPSGGGACASINEEITVRFHNANGPVGGAYRLTGRICY